MPQAVRKITRQRQLDGPVIRVSHNSQWQEWRVTVSNRPQATYYTSDRDDAFDTARAMATANQVGAYWFRGRPHLIRNGFAVTVASTSHLD